MEHTKLFFVKITTCILSIATFFILALNAHAAETIKLQIPIFDYAESQNIAEYIAKIYQYLLIVLVPLAIIVIIVSGILWISAAGDSGKITQAKSRIIAAFTGLGLALFSYIILSLVGITNLTTPAIQYIPMEDGEPLSDPIFSTPSVMATDKVSGKQYADQSCFKSTYGDSDSSVTANLVSITFAGAKVRVHKLAQAAFQKTSTDLSAAGLTSKQSTGTYNWRPNRNNPSSLSLHSFGIAIDIEWQNNGNCKPSGSKQDLFDKLKGQYASDIGQICAHAKEFGCDCSYDPKLIRIMMNNGFKWGGTYSNTFDAMHFEWTGLCFK